VIALAIDSGISPAAWWREDDRTIATALDLMHKAKQDEQAAEKPAKQREGVVMGG